ncbi:MAG TPA: ferric reductase-like transmembrane domain-containing protein [Acidimicrobiales bacterium]|nr:ferric reductase-like transmembrane domain-containing protein [Acidimicrobiales bacterium]
MSSTSLWYVMRASGIVTLVLLTLTMVLGLVTSGRPKARHWPGFAQQELHRRISMIAVVFLGLHVLTAVLDTYVHIGWLSLVVPFVSSYSPFWVGLGTVALDVMLAVFVSSLLRSRMRPGLWRAIHWLAYGCWPVALAHTFGMGTDAGEGWVIMLAVACILSVGASLAWRLRATAQRRLTVPAATPREAPPARLVASTRSGGARTHA